MQVFKLMVVSLFLSCANVSPQIVSGESLDVAGQQFVDVSHAMMDAHAAGFISDRQLSEYRDFAIRFQALYPVAVHLWEAAVKINNQTSMAEALDMVASLVGELQGFVVKLENAKSTDGGI